MDASALQTENGNSTRHLMPALLASDILETIGDGIFVTDTNRQIIFWNKAAARISGWSAAEVLGRPCYDNILCHVNENGQPLCDEDSCPMLHAILSDTSSLVPGRVYAQSKSGARIPVEVTVAPVHDEHGAVVGGVQIFQDMRDPRKSWHQEELTAAATV